MLVTTTLQDGSYDVYLHDATTGKRLDRITTTGKGYDPLWSPDGRDLIFKWGGDASCAPYCNGGSATCTGFRAPASARNLTYEGTTQLDYAKVPCRAELYWSSIA
jgi:hypothetical protein